MENTYKEIKILPADEQASDIVVKVEDDDGGAVDAANQEPAVQEPIKPVAVTAVENKAPRESRAQKRIKELHAEKEVERREKEELRGQMAELQKQLLKGHASTKENFKTTLEGTIKSLNSQLVSAMSTGNSDVAVQLQDQLMNAKIELQSLNQQLTVNQQEIQRAESAANQRPQPQNQVPEKALDWIEDHPEFSTDPVFNAAAIATNNQLLKEGFNPNDEDFYAEINNRLAEHFPKVFGVEAKSVVQLGSNQRVTDSSTTPIDVKVEAPVVQTTSKVRTVEQVVSGSSRPSANTIPSRKTMEVTLSAQDVKQAEAWGWSLERMAKRIMHIEKNKKENGYVPISY